MEVFRDIRAVVMDLDDTLISAYRRPDLLWETVCRCFQAQLGALDQEEAVRALTRAGQAFWGDPKRHALGRLNPLRGSAHHCRRRVRGVTGKRLATTVSGGRRADG